MKQYHLWIFFFAQSHFDLFLGFGYKSKIQNKYTISKLKIYINIFLLQKINFIY